MTLETTPLISSTTPEHSVTMPTTQPRHTGSATDITFTEEEYFSTSAPSTGNITVAHVTVTTTHTGVNSSATTFTHNSNEDRTWSEICCTSSAASTSRENNYTSTVTFTSTFISKATGTISIVSTNTSIVKGSVMQAILLYNIYINVTLCALLYYKVDNVNLLKTKHYIV